MQQFEDEDSDDADTYDKKKKIKEKKIIEEISDENDWELKTMTMRKKSKRKKDKNVYGEKFSPSVKLQKKKTVLEKKETKNLSQTNILQREVITKPKEEDNTRPIETNQQPNKITDHIKPEENTQPIESNKQPKEILTHPKETMITQIQENENAVISIPQDFLTKVDPKETDTIRLLKQLLAIKLPKYDKFLSNYEEILDDFKSYDFEEMDEKINKIEDESKFSLESDAYVLTSIVLKNSFSLILFIIIFLIMLFFSFLVWFLFLPLRLCYPNPPLEEFSKIFYDRKFIRLFIVLLITLSLLGILLLPAILVLITQYYCVSSILSSFTFPEDQNVSDLSIKWLLNIFFSFLIGNEVIQGTKILIFMGLGILIKIKEGFSMNRFLSILGYSVAILPPLAQITMAFVIYYLSICVIYVEQDMISFIENFAGFYIVLEFDNFAIKFLQNINFYYIFEWMLNKFTRKNK